MNLIVRTGKASSPYYRNSSTLKQRYLFITHQQINEICIYFFNHKPSYIKMIKDGWGSLVFELKLISFSCILKVGVFRDVQPPTEDFIFYQSQILKNERIPVPHPLVLDCSGDIIRFPFLIMEKIDGESLKLQIERDKVVSLDAQIKQVALALKLVHRSKMSAGVGYGHLTNQSIEKLLFNPYDKKVGSIAGRNNYVKHLYQKKIESKDFITILGTHRLKEWKEFLNQIKADNLKTTCIHNDPSLRNFLFKKDKLVGIIDASAVLGFPVEDVASCCIFIFLLKCDDRSIDVLALINLFLRSYFGDLRANDSESLIWLNEFIVRKIVSRIYTTMKISEEPLRSKQIKALLELAGFCIDKEF